MKKPIPLPAIIATIALFVALAGFFVFKGASGPPEFAAPKVGKEIPRYVWDAWPPDQQKKMADQGYKPADITPSGPAGVGKPAAATGSK